MLHFKKWSHIFVNVLSNTFPSYTIPRMVCSSSVLTPVLSFDVLEYGFSTSRKINEYKEVWSQVLPLTYYSLHFPINFICFMLFSLKIIYFDWNNRCMRIKQFWFALPCVNTPPVTSFGLLLPSFYIHVLLSLKTADWKITLRNFLLHSYLSLCYSKKAIFPWNCRDAVLLTFWRSLEKELANPGK